MPDIPIPALLLLVVPCAAILIYQFITWKDKP